METTVIGIDLAKNTFHLHGMAADGSCTLRKKISRDKLASFISQVQPTVIAMEACAGAHYWGRSFESLGHTVRLIAPKFVKPYVKSQKNDANDAAAIAEVASRQHTRFVPIKTGAQQDMLALHRIRSRTVRARTQLVNEARALMHEVGVVFPQGIRQFRKECREYLSSEDCRLGSILTTEITALLEELDQMDARVERLEKVIAAISKSDERVERLQTIPGVGPLTSTAIVAAIGDGRRFPTGRHFAAWLGLVPRQHSTGGKTRLSAISKNGDSYIRWLLIHGARSALSTHDKRQNRTDRWAARLQDKIGTKKTVVALANKIARQVWALLTKETCYCPQT